MIQPPINYTGSKSRLLKQIQPLLPEGNETFFDYFGGSSCVMLNNLDISNSAVYNDRDKNLVGLMLYLRNTAGVTVIEEIRQVIADWDLGKGKKEQFWSFRDYFNEDTFGNTPAEFLALMFHSFSSQIRYSRDGQRITSSSGDTEAFFRDSHERRIITVSDEFKKVPIRFDSKDLFSIDWDEPSHLDMVYLDPPYLASGESMYSHFWGEKHERYLLEQLDRLNSRGVTFALSNVLYSKGFTNPILNPWSEQYNVHDLVMSYKNSSHQVHEGKSLPTREVLITNY